MELIWRLELSTIPTMKIIKLSNENLDSDKLIDYELLEKQHINYQN